MHYMNKQEINRVLSAASVNRRDYLMIYLGYFAGLRAMEVCSLRRRNFDISTSNVYVTVQRSKGSDKTTHRLPPAVATLVRSTSLTCLLMTICLRAIAARLAHTSAIRRSIKHS